MKKFWILGALMMSLLFSEPNILIQVEKNVKEIGKKAYLQFERELAEAKKENKTPVFILPTGSTPLPFYHELIQHFKQGRLDLSNVHIFNMDEYVGLSPSDPNSYAYFLHKEVLEELLPSLTSNKLKKMGLRLLTKKECSIKKEREKFNAALQNLIEELQAFDFKNHNAKMFLEQCLEQTYKKHPCIPFVVRKFFNDQSLASLSTLISSLEWECHLFEKALQEKHIMLLRGNEPLSSLYNESYKMQLTQFLDSNQARVVCFAGIGQNPSHIAFNDLIEEEPFNLENWSEAEKNSYALNTSLRLVSLTQNTREANARFFKHLVEQVPQKAFTLGLRELLRTNHIIVLASGESKKESLYHTFKGPVDYKVPTSLLRQSSHAKVTFLMDESSFGIGEKSSLFGLFYQNSLTSNYSLNTSSLSTSFWEAPLKEACFILQSSTGKKKWSHEKELALPKNKKILWLQEGAPHYSFLGQLKRAGNTLKKTPLQSPEEMRKIILSFQPELIFFPYSNKAIEFVDMLKKEDASFFENEIVLGVFYDCAHPQGNLFYPLDKKEIKNKLKALKEFHSSQCKRSSYDEIAYKMSEIKFPRFRFAESFALFSLICEGQHCFLKPVSKTKIVTKKKPVLFKPNASKTLHFSEQDQVIAVAPHPDDLEIGLGGLIQHLSSKKVFLSVLLASNGHRAEMKTQDLLKHKHLSPDLLSQIKQQQTKHLEDRLLKGSIRLQEAQKALHFLNPQASLHYEPFPFYEARKVSDLDYEKALQFYEKEIKDEKKRLFVFLPYPFDRHSTHQMTQRVLQTALKKYATNHAQKEIFIVYYFTPWSGEWNLYDFRAREGSRLNALIGAELLNGAGKEGLKSKDLGRSKANRYQVFFLKN